jgi:FAD/FMN-containing dehydrogenase
MNRFRATLSRVSRKLDLPQPKKSRILLELSGDLNDAFDACLEQGMDEAEARRRVEAMFDLSDEAIDELVRVHDTALRKLLGAMSIEARTRWERALLVVLLAFIALAAGRPILSLGPFALAGPFVWPVAGFSLVALTAAIAQAYRLHIRRVYDTRRLRDGPAWILAAAAGCLASGFTGSTVEMSRAARVIAAGAERPLAAFIDGALAASAVMVVALLAGVLWAVVWSVLEHSAGRIAEAEVAWLYEE